MGNCWSSLRPASTSRRANQDHRSRYIDDSDLYKNGSSIGSKNLQESMDNIPAINRARPDTDMTIHIIDDSDVNETGQEVGPNGPNLQHEISMPSGNRSHQGIMSGYINDDELNKIGSGIGPNNLMDIARSYLKVPEEEIETYESITGNDKKRLKFKILEHWRNQNPGPDARNELFNLLEQARREHGGIDIKHYKFLVQPAGPDNTGKRLVIYS